MAAHNSSAVLSCVALGSETQFVPICPVPVATSAMSNGRAAARADVAPQSPPRSRQHTNANARERRDISPPRPFGHLGSGPLPAREVADLAGERGGSLGPQTLSAPLPLPDTWQASLQTSWTGIESGRTLVPGITGCQERM